MNKVYLAAPYGARDQVRDYAKNVTEIGVDVTSSWLMEQHEINASTQGAAMGLATAQVAAHATADFEDIDGSDCLVLFTSEYLGVEGGGGRHVETGYAIARGLPVIVVGEPENVFHRLDRVCTIVSNWDKAVTQMKFMFEKEDATCSCVPDSEITVRDADTGVPLKYVQKPGFWGWLNSGWDEIRCEVHL